LGEDLEITFTRKKFEEVCKPYFDKCLTTVDNALKLAKLKENDINEVVLIGGSTRIPYIQNMLRNKFENSRLCSSINPDETVSIGAAIQGAIIARKKDTKIRNVNLFDAIPLSLGIEVGEKMDIIIKRNTPTPIIMKKKYQIVKDNQTSVCIKVYEGEDKNVKKNNLLGKFRLNNLPKLPAREAKVEVTFFVDENNILYVSAIDASNNKNKNEITIINDCRIINDEEKEKIKKNIDKYDEYGKKNQFNLLKTRSLKKDIIEFREKIQNSTNLEEKYKYHKLLCQSFESFMKIFDLKNVNKNEAYLLKFKIYLTYLIKEYGVILSYGNLVGEDVIINIRNNLYTYVPVLIEFSDASVYELFQDLNINKKINDFCCIFRISENYNKGILLYNNKELKQAGKCLSDILQEASIHDLDTQLSFIDENSQNEIKKYVSDAKSYLHNFYIQDAINQADDLFNKAVKNNNLLINLNNLLAALDTYNWAIQLNKIEKENNQDEIIDEFKYDYCVCKINEILIHNLGEQNEEMKKLLEKLQIKLNLKKECNEKEKKQIEDIKKNNINLTNNEIKINNPNIFEEIKNIMNDIEKDIKKTAKECIKIILRDSPYPNYNNDFNVDDIFKNKNNQEIHQFILNLKARYYPSKYGSMYSTDYRQKENYKIASLICGHLNNILTKF